MKRLIYWLCLGLLLVPALAWAAGSSIVWSENTYSINSVGLKTWIVTATLTSDDATGAVTGTSTRAYDGLLMALESDPDGTAVPTSGWNFTLTDHSGGNDILNGGGLSRSATATQSVLSAGGDPVLVFPVNGRLTVAASSMGNAKKAILRFVIRE